MPETATPTPSTPAAPPQPNEPAARTPTGELLNQQTLLSSTPTTTEPSNDPTSSSPAVPGDTTTTEPTEPATPPAEYTPFTAPEGHALDQALVDAATPVFRELGLDQAAAQRLVDIVAKRDADQMSRAVKLVEDTRADWRDQTIRHPDMSGKLETVKADIGRAFTQLPPKVAADMKAAFDLTGAGDHPAVIRGVWEWAKLVNEGRHVAPGGPSPASQSRNGIQPPRTAATAIWPHLPHTTS